MDKKPVRLGKKPEPKPLPTLPDIDKKLIIGFIIFIIIFLFFIYLAWQSKSFAWYNYKL